MSIADQALIELGSRFGAQALLDTADSVVDGVNDDANVATFAKFKIDAAWKKGVTVLLPQINKAMGNRDTAEMDVVPTSVRVGAAFDEAKTWRNDCMTFADLAFPAGPIHLKFHAAAGRTGSSVPGLKKSVGKLAILAGTYKTQLKAKGAALNFSPVGIAAGEELTTANKLHLAALRGLSPAAKKLQTLKGKLYTLIKEPGFVARRQHIGSVGQFAVSRLVKAHTEKHKAQPVPPAVATK